ncbi:MAG: RNA polymerase sigma factor [Bacteroidales bacterium]|nr:RNA polymerase sigma factor [Bacteroidales bacterium]
MNKQENIYRNIHQDIIDRCKSGEQKAQFQLYKLYYKAMYNTCLRIVNNNLEAEDIMQESFLKAFEKIKMYKGEVSFGAWLKRIVINHSLDELRKKKFEMESIDDSFTELKEKKDDKGMIKEEELKIKAEEIRDEIKKLPDGYRIVLSLYLIEGYDHDEISEILNISSSTSRSQCARAKQKLLKNIQEKAKTNLI